MGHTEILRTAFKANIVSYSIVVAFIVLIPVLDVLIDKAFLKLKESKTNQRYRRTGIIIWLAVFLPVFTYIYGAKTIPMIKDINNESYVCVHGEYYMYNFNYRADRDADIYVTLDDGESIGLRLPKRLKLLPIIDEERFPSGKHIGTVWYAKNSHYILEFIPDESTDIS